MDTGSRIPIYTIGYGKRALDEFVAVLQANGIAYLVDVRSAPYSRFKPEFSRDALEAALRQHGIGYVFMGRELGGRPEDSACYTDGKVDYERVRESAPYQQGIARLERAYDQQQRVVLMCSEGKPEECHRSKLIGATLDTAGIAVCHIDENDELQTQETVIHRLTGGQLSLWGEQHFTSRKRYTRNEDHDD
jgi:uncharacterized protein (DUF488 family)